MVDSTGRASGPPLPVSALPARGRVLCQGFVESVTYVPATQVPSFTAILTDHEGPRRNGEGNTASPGAALPAAEATATAASPVPSTRTETAARRDRLRVVWLGRRRVPGVAAGAELRVEGMLTVRDGLPTIFNPRYEILSRQEEQ